MLGHQKSPQRRMRAVRPRAPILFTVVALRRNTEGPWRNLLAMLRLWRLGREFG